MMDEADNLPAELDLALAHTSAVLRPRLATFFALDQRLARIIGNTTEAMLGQMRLAWWRDILSKPVAERPRGDAVLDAIGQHWGRKEHELVALIDGWEHLIGEGSLAEEDARLFATGRINTLLSVYGQQSADGTEKTAHASATWRWALADLAAKVSDGDERSRLVRLGLGNNHANPRLPHDARGLAVLGALGLRALRRGGRPLMEGRGASLVALRAGILGR